MTHGRVLEIFNVELQPKLEIFNLHIVVNQYEMSAVKVALLEGERDNEEQKGTSRSWKRILSRGTSSGKSS